MSLNLHPESDLVSEADLRAALRPYRMTHDEFETGVRRRMQAIEVERARDPLAGASPLLRMAAAVLPVPIITGGKSTASTAPLANASGLDKVVGIVALPAISLFLLLGTALFGAARIRRIQAGNLAVDMNPQTMQEATRLWWRQHKWGARLLFVVTLGCCLFGATSLILLVYLISLGAMLFLLSGFARLGLANRTVIGRSAIAGLALLGQVSAMCTIGVQDIHFVDQMLLPVVFFGGALLLAVVAHFVPSGSARAKTASNSTLHIVAFLLILVPILAWYTNPIWRPTTPARIREHVEAFDEAPFASASWRPWEIVASWAIEAGLDPDLSRPRRLLDAELSKAPAQWDPFILGNALRTGLVRANDLERRHVLAPEREQLLGPLPNLPITSVTHMDWMIRVLEQRHEWSPEQKDLLEQRLLATMDDLAKGPRAVLEEALRVTQLLEVIGRPIDRDRYRDRVHGWLRELHCPQGGGFQPPGGFKMYRDPRLTVGSLEPTAYAVELMRIYGIPEALDLNWVRTYLRPVAFYRKNDHKYVAAVTLDRFDHLPGVSFPTWLDSLYYERSLVMAVLLVALCLYATLLCPAPRNG